VNRAPAAHLSFEVPGGGALAGSPAVGKLRRYLASSVGDGFPSGLALAVVDRSGVALEAFGGHACAYGEVLPAQAGTAYDLASLTKVVCSITLALAARQRGMLALDDPVTRWLPAYPQARTTLWHLATHTAGLVDHRPFYLTGHGRAAIEAAVLAEAGNAVPGATVRYSDLGYMLLGWVLEACFGQPLDAVFAAEVAGPLGLGRTTFRPPQSERHLIAATEADGDQREVPGLVWGEVHDGNAYALGGVAGHAGLFAPCGDLVRFVQMLLATSSGPSQVLSPESVALLGEYQAGDGEDVRAIGWRLRPPGAEAPQDWGRWPEGTIWHTGFTGTSLLVAPAMGAAVVLLTNSIHPRRRLDDQAAMRADVHRLVAEALR